MSQSASLNKSSIIFIVGGGLILGLLATFSPGSLFCLLLCLLIILAFRFFVSEEDKRFLIYLFISGILLRVFLLLSVAFLYALLGKWQYHAGNLKVISFMSDSIFYTVRGWWLMQYFSGQELSNQVFNAAFNPFGFSGHVYIIAMFYYLFGFSPISFTLTNCILSVLTGILFYFLTKELAGKKEARIVSLIVVFFPSMIIWSISNLKDSLFIFLTAAILWSFMQLVQRKKIRYLILFILAAFLQFSIRGFFIIPTFLVAGLTYLLIKKKFSCIFLFLLILIGLLQVFEINLLSMLKMYFIGHHRGVIFSGGSTYRLFDNWVYIPKFSNYISVSNLDIVRAFSKGILYFLLVPFPWRTVSVLNSLSLPQMIIWYFLLPFAMIGILIQLRYNWRKSLFLILYFFTIGSILVMGGGNVGTVFRLRDILTPIVIFFAVVGFTNTFYGKAEVIDSKTK